MKVYIFGNKDLSNDNRAFEVTNKLNIESEVIVVEPNADLPFINEDAVIIDTAYGIDEIKIYGLDDLDKFEFTKSSSVHDYDLAFQLKYLHKLGKLGNIVIIALPQSGVIDYNLIHLTLRKFVAHDMHGS